MEKDIILMGVIALVLPLSLWQAERALVGAAGWSLIFSLDLLVALSIAQAML